MSQPDILLYQYWRSSASYRVRIALALKGLSWRTVHLDLLKSEQKGADYVALNPQGLVPALAVDGLLLTQSLAIIDYIEMRWPAPALYPADPAARAQALARALVIAADTHPLQNSGVMAHLKRQFGADDEAVFAWNRHWIASGFTALERQAPETGLFGGSQPDISDVCLVPQFANARRYGVDLAPFPRLLRIEAELLTLPAFIAAAPEAHQPG